MTHIDVLALDLSDLGARDWPRLHGLLDEGERERAARFMFEEDRKCYVAAHGLLRLALSRRAAIAPENWRFKATPRGKPFLSYSPQDLRFSLSHTRGMVAVAIADSVDIGVDVEGPRGVNDALKLAERYFAPAEVCLLRETTKGDERRQAFLQIWTLKEAVIKATGDGLAFGLERFSIADGISVILDGEQAPDWTLAQWRRGDFHIAAAVPARGAVLPSPCDGAALLHGEG